MGEFNKLISMGAFSEEENSRLSLTMVNSFRKLRSIGLLVLESINISGEIYMSSIPAIYDIEGYEEELNFVLITNYDTSSFAKDILISYLREEFRNIQTKKINLTIAHNCKEVKKYSLFPIAGNIKSSNSSLIDELYGLMESKNKNREIIDMLSILIMLNKVHSEYGISSIRVSKDFTCRLYNSIICIYGVSVEKQQDIIKHIRDYCNKEHQDITFISKETKDINGISFLLFKDNNEDSYYENFVDITSLVSNRALLEEYLKL